MNHIVDAHVAYSKTISDLNRDKVELLERIAHLESAIRKTIDDNRHLADGDNCTLIDLKKALA